MTSLGNVYIFKPPLTLEASALIASNYIDIEADGCEIKNVHALIDTTYGTVYLSAEAAAALLGGSVQYKDRCFNFTTDGQKHSFKVTSTLPEYGDSKYIYPMSSDFGGINAIYIDGEETPRKILRSNFINTEMYVFSGRIYVPAEVVINGYTAE